jgi:precorrin-8X/cobalt-precorrin-8 methylmutase
MSDIVLVNEPGEIERRSFEIIDAEVPEPRPYRGEAWQVVRRMVHASADFELVSRVRFHPRAIEAGVAALTQGCRIITDTEMARVGMTSRRLEALGCRVACYLNDPEVKAAALQERTTRTAAAVDHALPYLTGGIYAVGNAPTALLRLLKWTAQGRCRPALILGMPVGFVNAAESKDLLMQQEDIPYISIEGRKGGSSLVASAVNQLAEIALVRKKSA